MSIPSVTVTEVPQASAEGVVIVDVREPHEWEAGHIEGAVHVPLGELADRVGELDPQQTTYVVCHLGGRSARATQWLTQQGFDATNVEGGMDAWESAGLPVTR